TEGSFSISMTTMNKVEYCLENIRTIAEDPDLRALLDVMYVVDQGKDRLTDHPQELAPLQQQLGAQLRIIEQGNIGGSGGFSRGMLHTYGEVCDPWRIQPAVAIAEGTTGHDFAAEPLRSTPWLHRRADVDYNGWWSCLIPTETVRAIGLSLPVFIKWDDAEYGL